MPTKKETGGPEDRFTTELRSRVTKLLQEYQAKNSGLTNAALATRLGINEARVAHIKRGQGDLSAYFLANLAKLVEVPLEELVTGEKADEAPKPADRGMSDPSEMFHLLLSRQNIVRAATAKLASSLVAEFDKHAERLEEAISRQDFASLSVAAPNQIAKSEIVELEKNATMVYVCSRDIPYLGKEAGNANNFMSVEANGIAANARYKYIIGGVKKDDEKQETVKFKNSLKYHVSDDLKEEFEKNFEARVEIVFYKEEDYRPVFSWALHNVNSMNDVRPELAMKYANYFHEILNSKGRAETWIGHVCFSLPEEKLFFLMHKDLLQRSYAYFNSEFSKEKKKR